MSINAKPITITDNRKKVEEFDNKILYNDTGKYIEIKSEEIKEKDGKIKTKITRNAQPYNFNRDKSVQPYFSDKFIKTEEPFLMDNDRSYEPLDEKNKNLYNNLKYEYDDVDSSYEVTEEDGSKSIVTGKKIKRTLKQKSYNFNRGDSVQPNNITSNEPKVLKENMISSNIDGEIEFTNIQDENATESWKNIGKNIGKTLSGAITNAFGIKNSDISQFASAVKNIDAMVNKKDISTKFDIRMKYLNEWKNQKYKELHPYDWKPGQSVPQDLMKSSLANITREGFYAIGDNNAKEGFKKVESVISPDPVKYVRNAIKAGKGTYITASSLQPEDFGKMKDVYWTSYVTSDKTGTVASLYDKSEEFSGNNKSLKEKKFIEAIKNRNTYNKTLGYLYIRPSFNYSSSNNNNDDYNKSLQIPFEFNPQISEGGTQANYATETLLNRIGQFQVYTGTNLSQTSISLTYMALAPDNLDEESSKKLGKQFSTDIWQYYWTNNRIESIENKLRSLVFPDMTQEYLVKPPLIEIHLGEREDDINTVGDLFKYPSGASNKYLEVSRSVTNGEINRYKKYIVTNVQIEPINEDSFIWPSLYGRKWNSDLNNGSPINNIEIRKSYMRRLGFKASIQCVEVTENFLDLVPDFKAYYDTWTSEEDSANTFSKNVNIISGTNENDIYKAIDELGTSLNTELDAKNINISNRKKLFIDARALAIIYNYMSTKDKNLYNFVEHINDFYFLKPNFDFLTGEENNKVEDLIAFKISIPQSIKYETQIRKKLFNNHNEDLKKTYGNYDETIQDKDLTVKLLTDFKDSFPENDERRESLKRKYPEFYNNIGNSKEYDDTEYSYDVEAFEFEKKQNEISKDILLKVKKAESSSIFINDSEKVILNMFSSIINSASKKEKILFKEDDQKQANIILSKGSFLNNNISAKKEYKEIYEAYFTIPEIFSNACLYNCLSELRKFDEHVHNNFSNNLQNIWDQEFSDGILIDLERSLKDASKVSKVNDFFKNWKSYLSNEKFTQKEIKRYCDNILDKYNICYNNMIEGAKEFSKIIDYYNNSNTETSIELEKFLAYSIVVGKYVLDKKASNKKIDLYFESSLSANEDPFGNPTKNKKKSKFSIPCFETYIRKDIEILSSKNIEKSIIDEVNKKIKYLNKLKKEIIPYDKDEKYVKLIDNCLNINVSIRDPIINCKSIKELENSYNLFEVYSKENAKEINKFKINVLKLFKELTKENIQNNFTNIVGNYENEEDKSEPQIKYLDSLEESHKTYSKDSGIENVFKNWTDCEDYKSMRLLTINCNDFEKDFSTEKYGKIPHNYYLEIQKNQSIKDLQLARAEES